MLILLACAGPGEPGRPSDSEPPGDSGVPGETAAETGEPGETAETAETADSGEGETGDTTPPLGPSLGDATRFWAEDAPSDAGRFLVAGDLTGDGVDDVLVAAMPRDRYAGGGWIVGSGPGGALDDVGIRLSGAAAYGAGRTIGVGDIDGDGFADAGFGAPYEAAGGALIVRGPITADRATDDLRLWGDVADYPGHGLWLADVTGDGQDDAIVGVPGVGANAGGAWVVEGPVTADGELSVVGAAFLEADEANSLTGKIVKGGGDLDGDGVGDILVTAPYDNAGPPVSGTVHVVYGPASGTIALGTASDGEIRGTNAAAMLGFALDTADMDGDGRDDLLLGSPRLTDTAGAVYVLTGPISGILDSGAAVATVTGTCIEQQVGDWLAPGDVDGDGVSDLLVGVADGGGVALMTGPILGTSAVADGARWIGEAAGDSAGLGVELADTDGDGAVELWTAAPAADRGAGVVYRVEP